MPLPSAQPKLLSLRLEREIANADGTFGKLIFPTSGGSSVWWYTCEDDWRDNKQGISCIPKGLYPLRRTVYHKKEKAQDPWWAQFKYETFEICDVPDRTRVLIHTGSTEEDTEACVLIGKSLGYLTVLRDEDTGLKEVRKQAVLFSRDAFSDFMRRMKGVKEAQLRITGVVG